MRELKCVICGQEVHPILRRGDQPEHYHAACADDAKHLAVVWHGKALKSNEEDLSWVRDKEDETGIYLGVAFDDDRGDYGATIVIHGVEAEGQGGSALEALDDAYDDLQQEVIRITAQVWQLGQDA